MNSITNFKSELFKGREMGSVSEFLFDFTCTIIGSAFLYDVKEYQNQQEFNKDKQKHFSIISKYFDGYKYSFLVKDARMFKTSIPYSGKLGFFNVDDSIINNNLKL